jgi:RNA polymerase sigma-70 factor (ECF subfamily)
MQHVMLMSILKLRAGELREPGRIVSFVFGACRMTVLDLRRGALRRDALLEAFGAELAPEDVAPVEHLDEERMARCLEALPQRERTVLVHTFYRDEPAQTVATALGLAAGNVRVIRHRALQRLRTCMGCEGDA